MCAVVRVRCSLAVVEHLEAVPRPFLGQKACDKYRKRGLVPGVLKGLGAGYFDIPIALRISDLVSFRERGGFLNREYKLVRLLIPSRSSSARARVQHARCVPGYSHRDALAQIIENKIKYVKPVDIVLDPTSMAPEHIVLQAPPTPTHSRSGRHDL